MLDAFIIEEIKRRERVRQQEDRRPRVEIPAPVPDERPPRKSDNEGDNQPQRSVVIIDV
jgi:hypothetical protein